MNNKPHFIYEIVFPLLAVVALTLIMSFVYQMWVENNNMLDAQENGVPAVACDQVIKQDLLYDYIEVTDAKKEKWLSIYSDKDGKFSVAFLATPSDQNQDKDTISDGLIVELGGFDSQDTCLQAAQDIELTGLLRSSYFELDFKHQENLSELFPQLDLSRCYVLQPNASGSHGVNQVTIVIVIMMGTLLLWQLWSLITSTIEGFKYGLRFKFEKETGIEPEAQVASTTFVQRPTIQVQQVNHATEHRGVSPQTQPTSIQFSDRPKCQEHVWLTALKLASFLLPAMAASTFLFPAWCPMGVDALLIFLTLGCWAVTFFSLAKAVRNVANSSRIRVNESSLPSSFTKHFQLLDLDLKSQGFTHLGTYVTNLAIKQVTREYLATDGQTLTHLTKTNVGVAAICCYSVLANGQVFATIDIEVPTNQHPLIGITTGVQGNLLKTLEIHDQIISQFEDVILKIDASEIDDAAIYIERLEQQATGMIEYYNVPVPAFKDLVWRLETAPQNSSEMVGSLSW